MTTSNEFLNRMFTFTDKASQIALDYLDDSEPGLKKDDSVITKADQEISHLAHECLEDFLEMEGHLLIDEESPDIAQYLDQSVLDSHPYIWAVDPIDGTRVYANGMPHFGISIGLLKDCRPWLGVVAFPALDELFYCNGTESYFVKKYSLMSHEPRLITPVDQDISSQSIFLCNDHFFKDFDWDFKDCRPMIPSAAIADLCWPAIGRGCGGVLQSHLWDFAGSWPILHSAGLQLRAYDSGWLLSVITEDLFSKSPAWKLKEYYILSSERNFPILKQKMGKMNTPGSSA